MENRCRMRIARRWNMGSRNRFSVAASRDRAHFCQTAFSRKPFVVNVSGGFERGGDLLLPGCPGARPVSWCDGRVAVTDTRSEFSRLVPLARLGSAPFRQQIEATPSERGKLSRRFDLLALDRLTAVVELRRQGDAVVVLEAAFDAELCRAASSLSSRSRAQYPTASCWFTVLPKRSSRKLDRNKPRRLSSH